MIVFLYFCQTLVAGALRVLIVVTALDLLDIGNSGLGFLNAAIGVGGLIGVALDLRARRQEPARRRTSALGLILIGLGLGLIGVWPTTVAALLLHRRLRDRQHARRRLRRDAHAARRARRGARPRLRRAREPARRHGSRSARCSRRSCSTSFGIRASLIVVGALLPSSPALLWRRLADDRRARRTSRRSAIELLRANPIFAPLPPADDRAPRREAGSAHAWRPATIVFRQGDPGDLFYIVEIGRCEISIDGEKVADAPARARRSARSRCCATSPARRP